jgi:sugar phosphate isomerase/epimerase
MKLITALLGLVLVTSWASKSSKEDSQVDGVGGLALYTLRNEMKADPRQTLKKVADAGYLYIEAAGYDSGTYYGMTPTEFKSYLNSIGLQPKSSHQGSISYENADQQIADAIAAGFEYIVVPVPPMGMFTHDFENKKMGMNGDPDTLITFLSVIGEKAHNAGIKLLYHNHDFEFMANDEGTTLVDQILTETNPEHVNFQIDLFWATAAGVDPIEYFAKYPGRFKAFHVKDRGADGGFVPVGKGTIDFKSIFAHASHAGLEFFVAEQDETGDQDPLEAIIESQTGLQALMQ